MSHLPPGSMITKIEVTPSEYQKTRHRAKVFYLYNGEVRTSSFDGCVLKHVLNNPYSIAKEILKTSSL